jgi:chemotaxis response regulator CheB
MSKKQKAPRARRAPQMDADAPVGEAVERAKELEKKVSRQARAEPDANAERAEGTQTGNELVAVVGLGASAGGLEAFRQLLERLPVDTGMAFVLVTHLDPKHERVVYQK